MRGIRRDYLVSKKTPIGIGGGARVYKAKYKPTGAVVAFKEALNDEYARRRMRREVEIQTSLNHPHIMPIFDHSADFRWFTMPLAEGDLRKYRDQLNEQQRKDVIDQAAQGLEAAHHAGHVHRDVTPANILLLREGNSARWVVADWGLVRQVHGHTTTLLTTETRFIGTQGFAAPEMWNDPHAADLRADVYSLGRVAAWLVTGEIPRATDPLLPDGPWRAFIREATLPSLKERLSSMGELRTLLTQMDVASASSGPSIAELAVRAGSGDPQASIALARLGVDEPENQELYLDHIVHLKPNVVIATQRDLLLPLIAQMRLHLKGPWDGRDFGYAGTPLRWLLHVAQAAANYDDHAILEDAAYGLFHSEAYWQQYDQRRATRDWLIGLTGEKAQIVARALRQVPKAALWYLEEGWSPSRADPVIRGSLEAARAKPE